METKRNGLGALQNPAKTSYHLCTLKKYEYILHHAMFIYNYHIDADVNNDMVWI